MAEISLAHLHPGIRHIALADDAVRLQAMRAKRWITHDPAPGVLAALREALDQPAGDRMENLLLIAESGMGKTMLLRKFQRDNAVALDAATGTQPHPIVLALMPKDPAEEAFFLQIPKAVGAPFGPLRRRHRLSLRETTFRLLRELGTRILMIDEINSILVGSARQQRQFLHCCAFSPTSCRSPLFVPACRRRALPCRLIRSCAAALPTSRWCPGQRGPELQEFLSADTLMRHLLANRADATQMIQSLDYQTAAPLEPQSSRPLAGRRPTSPDTGCRI
jgi:Bacterial TniB protein